MLPILRTFHLPTVWVSHSLVLQLPSYFRSTYKRISVHVKSINFTAQHSSQRNLAIHLKKTFLKKKNFPLLMLHGHIWSRKKILIIKMAPDIKQHITDQFVLANLILFIYFIYLILPTSFALH